MQRRDSQCAAQANCINSPKDGCVARNGAEVVRVIPGVDWTDAFTYEVHRGNSEHYLVLMHGGSSALPTVIDIPTGTPADVSSTGIGDPAYFSTPPGVKPRDNFTAQTVNDVTFIANKSKQPAMSSAVSPAAANEALVFVRAGEYKKTYTIAVTIGGTTHSWSYETPDNSDEGNAYFIATNQIAATLYRAMTGLMANADNTLSSGYANSTPGVAPIDPPALITGMGFSVEIAGNLIRIWREDNQAWSIESQDGNGDTLMRALKGSVQRVSDLPRGGFDGMVFGVDAQKESGSEDYYVKYTPIAGRSYGAWRECVKPGTKTQLDANTMPHLLVNTAANAFTVGGASWGSRIAGDSVNTAKDPYFLSWPITEMFWHSGRLAFLTEPACDWSKARNAYTLFPDTVQAVLADAPINLEISAPSSVSLLRRASVVDEVLYLWSQKAQFRVHSGQSPFKQDTVEAPPSSFYEFNPACNFAVSGKSIYFAFDRGEWAGLKNVQFQNGRIAGDYDTTEHVSGLIPSPLYRITYSEASSYLFVHSAARPSSMWLYNFLVQGNQIVQSAWNEWTMPEGQIIWSGLLDGYLYSLHQRADAVLLCRVAIDVGGLDPGGTYSTRLDFRVPEWGCTRTYNAAGNYTDIVLPYDITESEREKVRVVCRTSGEKLRGSIYDLSDSATLPANIVRVPKDITSHEFYVGLSVSSWRTESSFYVRTKDGVVPFDSLTISTFKVRHDRTAYYRVEVDAGSNRERRYEFHSTTIGQPNSAIGEAPALKTGTLSAGVSMGNEEATITIINDSPYPSRWQTAEYIYTGVTKAASRAGN